MQSEIKTLIFYKKMMAFLLTFGSTEASTQA